MIKFSCEKVFLQNAIAVTSRAVAQLSLIHICVAQNRQYAAFNAQRGLDDIGDIFHHVLALALAVDRCV